MIANDISSCDIEGENPLYLPQAKFYDRACALGPVITLADSMPPPAQVTSQVIVTLTRNAACGCPAEDWV